jgi:hypothetical protein
MSFAASSRLAMEDLFPAPFTSAREAHPIHRRVPFGRGDDGAMIRPEADQPNAFSGPSLARELPDVDHAISVPRASSIWGLCSHRLPQAYFCSAVALTVPTGVW